MAGLEIVEAAPGVWSVRRGPRGYAAYVVKTSPGAILIDTGPDPTGAPMMQACQAARVGLRSVRAILLTSSVPDASAGAAALRERCGSRVLCSPEAARKLQPFEADGEIGIGDVVEGRFEVVEPENKGAGRLAFRLIPPGALFVGGGLVLEQGAAKLV